MILTGSEIEKQYKDKRLEISDFNRTQLSTNSYDLTLGNRLLRYTESVVDPYKDNSYEVIEIPTTGITLQRGDFVLGESKERIGSEHYVPIIHGRSSTARLGLFVHVTADLIDIGSYGKTTIQLHASLPITLYSGTRIAQVSFWQPAGEITLYDGKYKGSEGPVPSRAYLDHLQVAK